MAFRDRQSIRQPGPESIEHETAAPPAATPARGAPEVSGDELAQIANTVDQHLDRMRWGPVWAGLLITLLTFAVLELAFHWLTFQQNQADSATGWISGLIGMVAFFLGGITAGSTVMWRDVTSGVLHGILVWALTTVGIILFTLFGGGALFGAVADVFTQVASLQDPNLSDVQPDEIAGAVRSAAGWALLGLIVSLVSATLGGAIGVKIWPRKRDASNSTP